MNTSENELDFVFLMSNTYILKVSITFIKQKLIMKVLALNEVV